MLSTFTTNSFCVIVSDSTVSFSGGAVRISNTLVPYDGTVTTFQSMSSFKGSADASKYQNVLMYLRMTDMSSTGIDMTRVVSDTTTLAGLAYPVMADSNGFPLGMFRFRTNDGYTPILDSYTSI